MHSVQRHLQDQIKRSSAHDPETDCWVWTGQISNSGYGRMMISLQDGVMHESAHRLSYLAFVGPLKKEDVVHQRCGNRLCVNPDHLFIKDNTVEKGVA